MFPVPRRRKSNPPSSTAEKEEEKEEVEAGEKEGMVEQKTRDVGPQPMFPVPRRRKSNPPSSTAEREEMSSSRKSKSQPERRMEKAMATQAETLEWHKKRWGQRSSNLILPPLPCPSFSSLAVVAIKDNLYESIITSESFTDDYVLLLFLPMDGSVDKTELEAFSEEVEQLESLGCQVVAITGDSVAAISHWIPNSQWSASTGICFPIISDKSLNIAKEFGVKRASGMMTRATFLLNKERKVCYSAVYPRCVARSPKEMVRQVAAARELEAAEGRVELPVN